MDIETQPAIVYVWSLKTDYIPPENIIQPVQMLCWAAKWLEEQEVEFRSLKHDGRRRMVRRLHKLLDQADCVLHYNGKRFDIPHVNKEFLLAGLTPPAPYQHIDLIQTARQFRFDSHKLDQVCKDLGIGRKEEHEGFRLWLRCMAGEESAWKRMRAYNCQDTRLTQQLYERLLPWIKNHPSYAAFTADRVCPRCKSRELQARGFRITKTGRYQRFQCKKCGGWLSDTYRRDSTTVTEIAA